jgi:ATP-dependent DNA helicase RecG
VVSAFANRPGGGIIVFGLDESRGFAPCDVYNVKTLQQGVADLARKAVEPAVRVGLETVMFEGAQLVLAHVKEAERALKPVRVVADGRAYLRQHDGTYPLSSLEELGFINDRGQPDFEVRPVSGTTRDDLDPNAVGLFLSRRRLSSPVFAQWSDAQVLEHSHVTTTDGVPTTGGLLALGVYPQSAIPTSYIQATLWDGPARRSKSRLLDSNSGRFAVLRDCGKWLLGLRFAVGCLVLLSRASPVGLWCRLSPLTAWWRRASTGTVDCCL